MLLQLLLWPVSVRFSVILLNSLPDIVYYSPPPFSLPRHPLCTLVNLPVFFTFAYHCIFYFAETLCHRFSVEITYLQYQYTADKHVCSVCDRNSRKIQKNTFLTGQTHTHSPTRYDVMAHCLYFIIGVASRKIINVRSYGGGSYVCMSVCARFPF